MGILKAGIDLSVLVSVPRWVRSLVEFYFILFSGITRFFVGGLFPLEAGLPIK